MASMEERVMEFVNDEKKVQALSSDEVFMDKVAGGEATPQDVANKFDELGLTLTDDDAKKIIRTANIILQKSPIAKIENSDLGHVTGGGGDLAVSAGVAGYAAGISGALGALGCSIAGAVCHSKANKAEQQGDTKTMREYNTAAKRLNKASITFGAISIAGLGVPIGVIFYYNMPGSV